MAAVGDEYDEILEIIRVKDNRIYYEIKVDVLIGGVLYPAIKVTDFDFSERYELNYGIDAVIEVMFDAGVYFRKIHPNRDNAKLLMRRKLMSSLSDQPVDGFPDKVSEWRIVDIQNKDADLQGAANVDLSQGVYTAKFALLDPVVEQMKMVRVGGIFPDSKPIDVLTYFLGDISMKLAMASALLPQGVTAVKEDMEDKKEHIVVPPGCALLSELPTLLQRECGGIYNHNIGIYYKFQQWYVYPLYNTKRYSTEEKVIDIVVLPPNVAPGIEKTYAMVSNRILISVTGQVRQTESVDIAHQNQGNGVRFGRASKMWDYAKVSGNKAVVNRADNVAEFLTVSRPTKVQNLPFSEKHITDNVAAELSTLSARAGYTVALTWHNSNPDILLPGMPVKIMVRKETGKEEMMGTLIGIESHTTPISGELTSSRYSTNSVLLVFVAQGLN